MGAPGELSDPFVPIERLDYARLVPLALLHLALTTGRCIEDMLAIHAGTRPTTGRCETPIYDSAERALFASPRLYPGLPKYLMQRPDSTGKPDAMTSWHRALAQHEQVYVPVTDVREIVLDDFGRWVLDRLTQQRQHLPIRHADALFFHVDGKHVEPLTREMAHSLVAHAITDYVRRVIPDAPPITFSRLRHTAWAFMVEQAGVHPILMQMQSDQARQNVFVPPSAYDKLILALLADVFSNETFMAEQRFVQVALLLMSRLGVTFYGCMRALCLLRVSDIGHVDAEGFCFVIVPRSPQRRRWLRVWLDDVTRCVLASLVTHLARTPRREGLRKRPLKSLDPGTYLATGTVEPPDDKRLDTLVRTMNAYLAQLCGRANSVRATAKQLLPTVRWVLDNREVYPSDIIAVLSGTLPTSAMPIQQAAADWGTCPALPTWDELAELPIPSATTVPALRRRRTRTVETFSSEHAARAAELHRLLQMPLGQNPNRRELAAVFESRVCMWLGVEDVSGLVTAFQAEDTPVVMTNLACLAAWLAALARKGKTIGTLRTYLSDGIAMIRAFPDVRVWQLGDEQREHIADFDTVTGPKLRRMAAWRAWRTFMAQLGLPLADLTQHRELHERATVEEMMLTPTDLAALMQHFVNAGDAAARVFHDLAPLAYFAMLRIQEVLRLRLCDVILTSTPYVEVRTSKGGKSRRVHLLDTPAEVIAHIRSARTWRYDQLRAQHPRADMAMLLEQPLVNAEVIPDAPALEKLFKRALTVIGKPSCTFHDLRKGGTNWHYLRGMPIKRIARWLGHATLPVTYLSYLRTTDLRQREAVRSSTNFRLKPRARAPSSHLRLPISRRVLNLQMATSQTV